MHRWTATVRWWCFFSSNCGTMCRLFCWSPRSHRAVSRTTRPPIAIGKYHFLCLLTQLFITGSQISGSSHHLNICATSIAHLTIVNFISYIETSTKPVDSSGARMYPTALWTAPKKGRKTQTTTISGQICPIARRSWAEWPTAEKLKYREKRAAVAASASVTGVTRRKTIHMIGMFRFWWSSVKTVFLRCIVRIQRTTFKFYTINLFCNLSLLAACLFLLQSWQPEHQRPSSTYYCGQVIFCFYVHWIHSFNLIFVTSYLFLLLFINQVYKPYIVDPHGLFLNGERSCTLSDQQYRELQ